MKLLSKYFLFLFLHLILSGCIRFNQDPLTHFSAKQTERIKPAKLIDLEDYDVLRPGHTIKYGDEYIINDGGRENVITCVNFSTNQFVSGVNFGQGPNELNMIGQLRKVKDKLFINDIGLQKIFEVVITQDSILLELYREINYDKRLYLFDYLGDHVIASGRFSDYWIGYIDIINNKLLSTIDFPEFEETSHLQGVYKSYVYLASRISVSPDGKKLVVATQDAGVISLSDIGENGLTEYRQIKYHPPGFKIVPIGDNQGRQGTTIAKTRDAKVGFCGLDCDDNYIYALYSGRTFNSHGELLNHCEHLLVYDWDGNPVKHYILDIPMGSMKYDSEKNSIYGIAYNPEGVFIEYQL